MANVTITQLPAAGPITGTESVPIVQNGVTVQTTTAALAGSPVQTQTFLTKNQEPTLNNSRALSNGTGVGLVDAGAQSTLTITLNAASGSLEAASNGMIAKTASNAVTARTMSSTTTGLSVTNGDGVAGNPTFALTGVALAVANASGTGALALTSSNTVVTRSILGTTNQISVTDGDFANSPVIAISPNPVLSGTGGLVVPAGTTGQRGSATNGNLRYNSTTGTFEGYANNAWGSITTGTGVTSVATGTGLTGGPITSTGTISLADTAVTIGSYTRASITVDQQGRLTSAASGPAINLTSDVTGTLPIANGGTGATTSAGAAFALKGANTDLTSVALTTGTVSTTPSASNDIANKSYVDTVAQGLDTKASCVAATTVNITLSAPQTIDGVSLVAGDRCLVKNQSTASQNGIYVVAAAAWTRATDMDVWAEVPGAYVFVETGTTQADTGWVCTSNAGGTIGTTAITWAQFSGAGSGVSSLSFGSTGLTPSSATTGAITVAGTLAVANGGTGVTTSTGTGSTVLSASPTFTGTLGAAAITASTTLGVTGSSTLTGSVGIGGAPVAGVTLNVADSSGSSQVRVLESVSGVDTRLNSTGGSGLAGIIGTYSNHPLVVYVNAVERMRIDSSGNVGIGGAPSGGPFNVRTNIASGAYSAGIQSTGQVQSAVSTRADMFLSSAACAAGTYAQITGYQAQQSTLTGTVTNQIGFNVDSSLTGATNNYGFYGNIASGTNRYNLYMAGTAANYLAGTLTAIGGISGGTF